MRGVQYRVAKNEVQLTQTATYKSDGRRFEALGLDIRPWHYNLQGHRVIIEQSPEFMQYVACDPTWLKRALQVPARHGKIVRRWSRDKLKIQTTLEQDLIGCSLLVAHTSAAAVTAARLGIPVDVSKMHALYGMGLTERPHYFGVMADAQWTLGEIRDGKAWEWLQANT